VPTVAKSSTVLVVGGCATTNGWQAPPEHAPPLHECPQVPQFAASVWKLLHTPLQAE